MSIFCRKEMAHESKWDTCLAYDFGIVGQIMAIAVLMYF